MSECTHENIITHHDACKFVSENCASLSTYVDFIKIYYCDIGQNLPLVIIISIVFAFFVFNIFGAISDSYLAPALEIISKKLKLSETIAGITLLALAASAPDVVTGIVAGGKEEGGIRIAVGGLFGACLFTVTVVLAGCIRGAKEIEADRKALIRDIVFLLFAVLYFVALTIIQNVTPLLAAGFFMLYVLFFAYVIFEESRKKKAYKQLQEKLLPVSESSGVNIQNMGRLSQSVRNEPVVIPSFRLSRDAKSFDDIGKAEVGASILKIRLRENWRRTPSEIMNAVTISKHHHHPHRHLRKVRTSILEEMAVKKQKEKEEEEEEEAEESETSIDVQEEHIGLGHRILKLINVPILFLGDLTMPPFEAERWSPIYAFFAMILGPLFLSWELGLIGKFGKMWQFWAIFGSILLLCGLFVLIKGAKLNLAAQYPAAFSTLTLIISVFWLNLVSTLVVDFLSFIQVITGLSLYLLSMTILAWGNSLEDYFVNYTIAKKGHGRTSLGGVYGSQIFAIMIGFGGGLFRLAMNSTVFLDIYNLHGEEARENYMTLFLLGSVIAVLGLTLVVGKMSKWVLGLRVVIYVLSFYLVFTLGIVLIAFA